MRRTCVAGLLLAALSALAAACSPEQPGATEDAGGLPGEAAELAYAQCMRDEGVDFLDPEYVDGAWQLRLAEGVDPDSPAFVAAEAACAQVLEDAAPDAGADPQDRAQLEEQLDLMLQFAQCMREQGIDFPDPQMDDSGTISGPAGPMDGDWEAFDTAREVCEEQTGQRMD